MEKGFNPFKFGLVGATDFHAGISAVEEDNSTSTTGDAPRTASTQVTSLSVLSTPSEFRSISGLTAVWAAKNTREEIFAAFRRREVYATTGTRLRVRFFGGWNYPMDLAHRSDQVAMAYARGVPMGQTLAKAEAQSHAFSYGQPKTRTAEIWIEFRSSRDGLRTA